jgi:hypothetical protein
MTATEGSPYFFPKLFLALLPAVYAWQVHGWVTALCLFMLVLILLALLGWTFIVREWSLRKLVWARTALILLSMAAVGVSAMEACNADGSTCHRVFVAK